MSQALKRLKFRVRIKLNKTRQEMVEIISKYKSYINRDDLVVFYFAGHGYQHGETNYIVGIDGHSVRVKWILDTIMEQKPYGLLMICDCCRNYSNKSMGQMTMRSTKNVTIELSCQADASARENRNKRNGYYTESLLRYDITNKNS